MNNIDVFDFTIGDEEYKKRWCNASMNLYSTIQANTLIGRLYVVRLEMGFWIRKASREIRNSSGK